MWTSKGLFKEIICPMGAACRMPNCIFAHDFFGTKTPQSANGQTLEPTPRLKPAVEKASVDHAPEHKKRKIDHNDDGTSLPPQQPAKKAFVGGLVGPDKSNINTKESLIKTRVSQATDNSPKHLKTVQRPISPPPKSAQPKVKVPADGASNIKKESLNPRPVKGEPAQWAVRYALLQKLHEAMAVLNKKAKQSPDAELQALHLSDNELVKAALDEEEHLAKTQGKVYRNMTGQRVMSFKKMSEEDWKAHLLKNKNPPTQGETETKAPQRVDTGLSPEQETMFLSRLITNQAGLDRHGYVTRVPSSKEIEEAREAVKWVANWEVCDRCATRFQVFPDRREDGALTTGGHCTYHPGKTIYPPRKKTDNITGREEPRYMCCREPLGSRGCVTVNTHVFKVADPKRMAAIMPFIETPPNPNPIKNKAVCFDCEMGYTVYGLEVIRLTATSWPDGESLIDVLVRPLGTVLDLNTRYSGVTPDQFFSAPEYNATVPASSNPRSTAADRGAITLGIVSSPEEARALLLSHISPETPLLGHALENDLNVMRLVHPNIIDTVLLYPHVRGLPIRHSLKTLAKSQLGQEIQTAGAAGHDSLEDARSTGELVRAKVAKEWRKLQDAGWTVTSQGFCPPEAKL